MKIISLLTAMLLLWSPALFSKRIVTLAPALTEIICELGQGDSLVGNTRFCDYPEAARSVTRVGGLMDLDLERIIQLKPDLIILYPETLNRVKVLRNRASMLVVKHNTLNQILDSIQTISLALHCPRRGAALISRIRDTLNRIKSRTRGRQKPKVLLIAGRNPEGLRNMTLIGRHDFLNEILEIAGGVNAYSGSIGYPSVSMESIFSMNPDHIIEFSVFFQNIDRRRIMALWESYQGINAVKNRRITIITDPVWLRPGPRMGLVAEKLYRLLNPDDHH